MAETQLPLTVQLNWQDSIDRQLQKRLMRPLVQPGLTNTSQLARVIISRSHRLSDRLPLLTELSPRLSHVTPLQAAQTPIVYAQPLANVDNNVDNFAPQISSTTANTPAHPSPIVQAKALPQGQVNSTANLFPNASGVGTNLEQTPNVDKNLDNFAPQINSTTANTPAHPSPIVQAKALPQGQVNSPHLEQTARVYSQPRGNLDNNLDNFAPQISATTANTPAHPSPIVQAKALPQGEIYSRGNQNPNSSGVAKNNEFTQSSLSGRNSKDNNLNNQFLTNKLESQIDFLPQKNYHKTNQEQKAVDSTSSSLSQLVINKLPIVQAKLSPARESYSPSPTALNSQISTNIRQSSLLKEHTGDMSMTGWHGLETPLILPTSAGSLEIENESQSLPKQQNITRVKPEIPQTTQTINAGTVSHSYTNVSPSTTTNFSSIAAFAESSSPVQTDTQTPIDVDVLADQIERKLMRRLMIENERRGQKRWR